MFVEQGRVGCESWYRASRKTVNRWMQERGLQRLINLRAAYVARQRAAGQWMTRSTKLVEHREVRESPQSKPVRDRRKVSFTLARHAAQHLRIVRNGGFIVSPTGKGDWWVGSRRLSAGQMLDLAVSKGFDRVAASKDEEVEQGAPQAGHGYWGQQAVRAGLQPKGDDEVKP
jgi:hypothetical protein